VYFHVIYANNSLAGGNIPEDQIHKQMKVLNNDFANSGSKLNFKLTAINVSSLH